MICSAQGGLRRIADVGPLLRRYRVSAGLTQEELAERAGIGVRSLGDIERGVSRPRVTTLDLLVQALGLGSTEATGLTAALRGHLASWNRAAEAEVAIVGRQAELEMIDSLITGTGPQILIFGGEPGIGKSALLAETARRVGPTAFPGGCLRQGVQEPYSPLPSAIHAWLRHQPARTMRSSLRGCTWLIKIVPEAAPYLDEFPPQGSLPPDQEKRLILDAMSRLLRQSAGPVGSVLVLDDLQWASAETLDMIASLVTTESNVRVAGAYRAEELRSGSPLSATLAEMARRGQVRHHTLSPLAASEAQHLLEIQGLEGADPEVIDRIIRATGGVPFYLVRYAMEGGRAGDGEVPWSISQSIAHRVGGLSITAQRVLGAGAVAGRLLDPDILQGVTGASLSTVLEAIDEAVGAGLVVVVNDGFGFAHDVIREVVERSVPPASRRILHGQVARTIEYMYPHQLDRWYEELAHQYSAARLVAQAIDYLLKSADKAGSAGTPAEALRHYDRVLQMSSVLGPAAKDARAHALESRGKLRFARGEYAHMAEDFERLEDVARESGDARLQALALIHRGMALLYLHEFDHAETCMREAVARTGGRNDELELRAVTVLEDLLTITGRLSEAHPLRERAAKLAASVHDSYGRAYWGLVTVPLHRNWEGRFAEAQEVAGHWTESVETRDPGMNLWHGWTLGLVLGGAGEYSRALQTLGDTMDACERLGDLLMRARVLNTMGWIHAELYDYERALELNRQSLALAEEAEADDPEIKNNTRLNLADCLVGLGRIADAEPLLEEVEYAVRHPRAEDRWMLWRYAQHLFHSRGELCLMQGEIERAAGYAEECVRLADQTGSRKNAVKGLRLLAEVAIHQRRVADAQRDLDRALHAARDIGNPPQLWKTLIASAQLHDKMGDLFAAAAARAEAMRVINSAAAKVHDPALLQCFTDSPIVRSLHGASTTSPR